MRFSDDPATLPRIAPRISLPACALLCAATAGGAAFAFAQATHRSPEAEMRAHYDAAYRLQAAGDIAGADREHRLFLSEALHHVANARANIGAYDRAAPLYDQALRFDPRNIELQFDWMKAAMDAENPQQAEQLAEGILNQQADLDNQRRAWLLRIHGEALRMLGRQALAIEQFKASAALDSSFDNVYALGNAYLWVGDKPEGAKVFASMLTKFGDTAIVHMDLGRGYAEAGYYQESIAEFTRAIEMDGNLRGAHYSLGASLLSLSSEAGYPKAEAEFRRELALNPDDPFSYPQLGMIALARHEYSAAETDLRRAVALNPGNSDNYVLLARLYVETQRVPDAIAALRKAIDLTLDPSRNHYAIHAAHYELGRLLLQIGQTAEGKKEMQIAEDLLSQSDLQDKNTLNGKPQVQLPLSTTRLASAAQKQEANAYESGMAPLIAGSFNNLGVHAAMSGEYPGAADDFGHAAEWDASLAGVDNNWGRAAFAAHEYAVAVPPLQRVLRAHPDDREARTELGVSLYQTANYTGALATLRPIAGTLAADPQLETLYAECAAKAGAGLTNSSKVGEGRATPTASQ
jgi:tetratricopeptide (TPR) repeat protein